MGPGGVTVTSPGAPSAPAPALTRLSPSGALGPAPGSVSPHVGLAHPGRSPTWGESGGGARSPSFGQRRSPYSPGPEDRTGTSAPGGGGVGGAGPHPGSVSPSGSSGSGAGVGGGPDRVTAGPRSGVGPTSPGSTGPGRAGRPSPLHSVLLGGCAHASAVFLACITPLPRFASCTSFFPSTPVGLTTTHAAAHTQTLHRVPDLPVTCRMCLVCGCTESLRPLYPCVCVCAYVCVRMCVCLCGLWQGVRVSECVCMCGLWQGVRVSECVCMCVWQGVRFERVCVCVVCGRA